MVDCSNQNIIKHLSKLQNILVQYCFKWLQDILLCNFTKVYLTASLLFKHSNPDSLPDDGVSEHSCLTGQSAPAPLVLYPLI